MRVAAIVVAMWLVGIAGVLFAHELDIAGLAVLVGVVVLLLAVVWAELGMVRVTGGPRAPFWRRVHRHNHTQAEPCTESCPSYGWDRT